MNNVLRKHIRNELKQGKTFLSFTLLRLLGELSLFLIPLTVAKILAPGGFGSYSLSMMVVYFFTSLLISASQTPFIIYSNEELKKTGKINRAFTIQIIFFIFSMGLFLILVAIFNNPLSNFTAITKTQLSFMIFAYIGVSIRSAFTNLFLAFNKRVESAVYVLKTGVISLVYIVILYYFFIINIENIFMMFFVSSFFASVLMIKKIDFNKLFPLDLDKKLLKEMFDFTKWQMFGLTAVYFINWGDNLVLRYFVSIEEVGVYNLGYQIFKGLVTLTFILNSYFLPFISQNIDNKEKIRNYLYVKRTKIMFVGTLGLILLFLMIPYAFDWIYGDIYKESVTILRILLMGSIIILYNVFYTPILNSLKKYKFYQTSNIIQIIINILLDIVLIPIIGVSGAAVATVIAYLCKTVMFELYIYIKIRHYSIISWLAKK